MKKWNRRQIRRFLPAICYGGFLLLWLLAALVRFVGDESRAEYTLAINDAEAQNLQCLEGDALVSLGGDPQLVFAGINKEVRLVRLAASFARQPGEMELFYTRREGQGFAPEKRVIGVPQADGSYLYTLPAGPVHALRLDPGTAGDNTIWVEAVTLNPKMPASFYFVPTLRDGMAFLLWPALLLCGLYAAAPAVRWGLARFGQSGRGEKREQTTGA